MKRREEAQQGAPRLVDAGFPSIEPGAEIWFRAHAHVDGVKDGGCWFFASLPAKSGVGGRFDLQRPRGTCYWASTAIAAARERLGRHGAVVAHDEVESRVVSESRIDPGRLADLLASESALHEVTGELSVSTPYAITQQWAAEFARTGFDGVHYQPRFSPNHARALALFGQAGVPKADKPKPRRQRPMADVLRESGYVVLDAPLARDLGRIID